VPPFLAGTGVQVPLVLLHGWLLFVLGAAVLVDFAPAVTPWIGVAVLVEVAGGLLLASGVTEIFVRDVGLLALALVWALDRRPFLRNVAHSVEST
jgi:hypothetical protein